MIIYSEPKTASELPVIDIGPSFSDDTVARDRIAEEIGAACRDTGFFYISNHGVDQSLIDGAFVQANRFFDQPHDRKEKCKKQGFSNGYEPPESQRLDNESPGDIKESFNFTMGNVPGTPGYKANIWPEDFPGFRDTLEAYEQAVWQAGLQVSRLISLSLGMPFNHFDETFAPQKSPLRILRYPPHQMTPNLISSAVAHTRIGVGLHCYRKILWGGLRLKQRQVSGSAWNQSPAHLSSTLVISCCVGVTGNIIPACIAS